MFYFLSYFINVLLLKYFIIYIKDGGEYIYWILEGWMGRVG